jgi:flagellar M-ring protein FliF
MAAIDIAAARERGAKLFAGFPSGQKTTLALAAVATIVGGFLFMRMSSSTEMAPLYSNLTAESASEITAALDSAGVGYELADGGSTIQVSRTDVQRVRLDLASEGLPRDGAPGYSLLDEQGITTSEFRQRIDYQRAMEGELASTINAIDGVDSSIVHLVMPEDDLFSGDAQHPSASVLVSTAPNQPLGAMQVQAVVHLVASSVEGLEAQHVTVADNAGRVLSAPGEDGAIANAADIRASQTSAFEAAVVADIEELLIPVAGLGRVRVNVDSQLDFDSRETTSETFGDPGTAPVVQESTRTETFEGTDANAVGGVLGPDALPVAGTGSESTYGNEEAERVFANDKTTTHTVNAPGDVQRLSIGVVVDEAANVDIRAIEQLIQNGTLFDAERGDTIEVSSLPFDTSAAEAAQAELDAATSAEARQQLFSLLRTVASVLIVAVVLFLAWRSHRKGVERYPLALALDGADPDARGLPVGSFDGLTAQHSLASELEALHAGPSEADMRREELQGQITDMIDRQADDVAQVLRAWMSDK